MVSFKSVEVKSNDSLCVASKAVLWNATVWVKFAEVSKVKSTFVPGSSITKSVPIPFVAEVVNIIISTLLEAVSIPTLGILGNRNSIDCDPLVHPNSSTVEKLRSINSSVFDTGPAAETLSKSKYPKKVVPLNFIIFSPSEPGVSSEPAEALPTITLEVKHCKYCFLIPRYTLFACNWFNLTLSFFVVPPIST